jgi:hypothetical protein
MAIVVMSIPVYPQSSSASRVTPASYRMDTFAHTDSPRPAQASGWGVGLDKRTGAASLRRQDPGEPLAQIAALSPVVPQRLSLPPSLPGAGTSAARSLSAPTAGPVISRKAALAVGCLGT